MVVFSNLISVVVMIHVGNLIETVLHEKGKTVKWFAQQLCCSRTNVYKIFQKENLDINIIWRASHILQYDFFKDISEFFNKEYI